MISVRCADRHEMEGHLRTLAVAWGTPDGTRERDAAARARLQRAMRVLVGR